MYYANNVISVVICMYMSLGKDFSKQFESIKSIIDSNITTLENLFTQSDSLKEMIEKIGKDGTKETIDTLTGIKRGIDSDISSLMINTKKLFITYNQLVNEMMD